MPNVTINPTVNWGTTGVTLYYHVTNAAGADVVARTATGIAELPAGSSQYHVTNGFSINAIMGQHIDWDDGTNHAGESLDVYISAALAVDLTTGLVAAIWAYTTRTLTGGVAQVVRSHQTGTLSIVRGESYLNADGNPISIVKGTGAAWPTTISGWTIKLAFLEQASNVEVAGTTPATNTGTVVTATGDSQAVRFDMTKVVTAAMATGHAVYKYSVWATSGDSAVELEQGTADVMVGVAT